MVDSDSPVGWRRVLLRCGTDSLDPGKLKLGMGSLIFRKMP